MMSKTFNKLFLLLITISFGCTKDEVEGPLLNEIFGNFQLNSSLIITNNSPDFSTGNELVKFHCDFNKSIEWKISIFGFRIRKFKRNFGFFKFD